MTAPHSPGCDGIFFSPAPPRKPEYHRVYRLPAGRSGIFWLLGDPRGVTTHFANGRTVPCQASPDPEQKRECEHCRRGLQQRWHAYVAAMTYPMQTVIILEMPAQCYHVVHDSIGPNGWRGWRVGLRRGRGASSRVHVDDVGPLPAHCVQALPPPPDIGPAIARLLQMGP